MARIQQSRSTSPEAHERESTTRESENSEQIATGFAAWPWAKDDSLSKLMNSIPLDADNVRAIQEYRKFLHALRVRWNYPGRRWGADHEYLYRALIHALGLQYCEKELLREAKPQRGRPATKRAGALRALEAHVANPDRTWRELAREHYGCQHSMRCNCGQLLRQETIHLKRLLNKANAGLPDTPRK
jgi:hypothetical protein